MNYYNEIKNELLNNEINRKVKTYSINKSDLNAYYNVGKILSEAGKHYGEGIIKNFSYKLKKEVDKKFNETNLKRMRQFYLKIEKGATMWHQLSWSHYKLLISLDSIEKMNYYSQVAVDNLCSVRALEEKIKSNEFERIPLEAQNKLRSQERLNIIDYIKNPIIIRNDAKYKIISEKILQKIIVDDIESFMKELGNSFCFIGSEYKIKLGSSYNYIDLLLFNIEFNCYVVVELKVTELQKEHIGQVQIYMNYIDENIKKITQNKTIGIIVCKEDNKYIIKYSSDSRVISRKYILS